MFNARSFCVLAGLITSAVTAPTSTLSKRKSPVLPGLEADPNIGIWGNSYYIYPTSFSADWNPQDFNVWKSQNLVDWEKLPNPILRLTGTPGTENGNVPWANGKAWAPTMIQRGDKWYFYFVGNNPNQGDRPNIGVAVGSGPEGPFTAQPEPLIRNTERITANDAIDPCVFRDPQTDKHYLYWGNGKALFAELNDDMTSLNWDTLGSFPAITDYSEAPFVNFRNGLYHFTYSIGDTRNADYRIAYATSQSPTGPWTMHGVLLEQDPSQGIRGTGHNSIIHLPNEDTWFIAYHRFKVPGGDGYHRETTIDRLHFGDDGLMQPLKPTLDGIQPHPL